MNHSKYVQAGGLRIAAPLDDLVRREIAPGTALDADAVWEAFGRIVEELGPENRRLLDVRDEHEAGLDRWHSERAGKGWDPDAYREHLRATGYLLPEGEPLSVTTRDVDPEIASVAGPQLVVPVDNARYALNAANARWGSLYDALYGTDVIPEEAGAGKGTSYNPVRGVRVIAWAEKFLDEVAPLSGGRHAEAIRYALSEPEEGEPATLRVRLANGGETGLRDPGQFVGFRRGGGGSSRCSFETTASTSSSGSTGSTR